MLSLALCQDEPPTLGSVNASAAADVMLSTRLPVTDFDNIQIMSHI